MVESRAPVLEMLWEAYDPHDALDGRFGFSDGESASRWVAAMLDEHWGVRIGSCEGRISELAECRVILNRLTRSATLRTRPETGPVWRWPIGCDRRGELTRGRASRYEHW
jgi:hypothetical protein